MIKKICSQCNLTTPVNGLFLFQEEYYCAKCAEKKIAGSEDVFESEFTRQCDETVCANCGYDNGNAPLGKLINLPVCDRCLKSMIERPFPAWIKLSAIALAVIVLSAFAYNANYLSAFIKMKRSRLCMSEGNLKEAKECMRSASDSLPQITGLKAVSCIYSGIYELSVDKPMEALEFFKQGKSYTQSDATLDQLVLHAEAAKAFNSKDYKSFYEKCMRSYKDNPENGIEIFGAASAASCMFVATREVRYKNEALRLINLGEEKIKPEEREIANDFKNVINYRMASSEILSREQYKKRFPKGGPK